MKNIVKKAAVTFISTIGIFVLSPSGFCSGNEPGNFSLNGEGFGREAKVHIEPFHMMTVGKYLKSAQDFVKLAMVNKNFRTLPERYKYNPTEGGIEFFPNIQTLYVYDKNKDECSSEDSYPLTFPNKNVKKIVYCHGTFANHYEAILKKNGIERIFTFNIVQLNKYNWERTLRLKNKNNPIYGCELSFKSHDGRELVFEFIPTIFESKGKTIRVYNEQLCTCGIYSNEGVSITPEDYDKLNVISLPENLESVGRNAFYKCKQLHTVFMHPPVKVIREGAFNGCVALKNIKIPDSVKIIGIHAFKNCRSLSEINIPESVNTIADGAFEECRSLNSIDVPYTVDEIHNFTFKNCHSLQNVTLPNSITKIGEGSFLGCKDLENIYLPPTITDIKREAFKSCKSLKSVVIPIFVKSINYNSFAKCSSLKDVYIMGNITSIGESAFEQCYSLDNISIPDTVASIGEKAFERCRSLKKIVLPSNITEIREGTFRGCSSLDNVFIPNSVTVIGANAFEKCQKLKVISIPTSVTRIEENAFKDCNRLNHIRFNNIVYGNVEAFMEAFNAYQANRSNN